MPEPGKATILVGYAPTPEGAAALAAATDRAERLGAHLAVLNTADGGRYDDPAFASEQDIDAVSAELDRRGVAFTILRPVDDLSAAESLVEHAERLGAELVVIGLRRRSAVGKMIHGSTAQAVFLDAPCPVMGVKARGRRPSTTS